MYDLNEGGQILSRVLFDRIVISEFNLDQANYIVNPTNWEGDIETFKNGFKAILFDIDNSSTNIQYLTSSNKNMVKFNFGCITD
jgi:hypothetical protein